MARHFVAILCCFASLELIGPALRAETVVVSAAGYVDVERGKIVEPAVIVVEDDKISAVLDPAEFPTAPAQGALAIQIRKDDPELAQLVSQLDDQQPISASKNSTPLQ